MSETVLWHRGFSAVSFGSCECHIVTSRYGQREGALPSQQKEFILAYLQDQKQYRLQNLLVALGNKYGDDRGSDDAISTFVKNAKHRQQACVTEQATLSNPKSSEALTKRRP